MKLLDLFSGMCGFSHAAEKHGFFTTAFCEIDKFCHRVIQKHYPDRHIHTDIRSVNGGEIEPVDVVTFGSPCQNLSIAGKQEGLEGKQSCLFYEAIRIVREMREKTDGRYPRYAVWENVPGAFSSNKRQDFRAVLEEITQAKIPMPRSGRWANAGMVRGNGRSVAWRVLDAQYWGVPQRRRRIFLVADFRGQSAPEILFECEGMSGDITESGKEGQGTAAGIGEGVTTAIPINTMTAQGRPSMISYGIQGSMIGRADKNGPQGNGINQEVSFTLNTTDRHAVAHPRITGTLCTSGAGMNRPAGMASETDLVFVQCLTTGTGQRYDPETETLLPMAIGYQGNKNIAHCVRANASKADKPDSSMYIIQQYTVRRLTPLECLRLQGFPDDWLDGLNLSDTAKYRMIGNSVAIPCVEYVMERIARYAK